ncbi:hypothetical protein PC128_g17221 [Phytophthora cactorum]|nr:hypothetical protein PC128_g17221 [Phytophthora cactorum]
MEIDSNQDAIDENPPLIAQSNDTGLSVVVDDPMEELTEPSDNEEKTEHAVIEKYGGTRKDELPAISTEGLKTMAPGKRKALRGADLGNDTVSTNLPLNRQ